MTDKYRKYYIIYRIISALLVLSPIIVYTILGFINGTTREKVVLGLSLTLALIFVILNIVVKHRIRSTIWIILIGIYVSVDNIIPLLITVSISTILDEFVFEPLYKKYKSKLNISKEIDKRIGE